MSEVERAVEFAIQWLEMCGIGAYAVDTYDETPNWCISWISPDWVKNGGRMVILRESPTIALVRQLKFKLNRFQCLCTTVGNGAHEHQCFAIWAPT